MHRLALRLTLVALMLLLCACSSSKPPIAAPAVPDVSRGAITVSISPNPIVARAVSAGTYEFPFEVVVHETGGVPVHIDRVSVDVYALGGILRVYTEAFDSAKIVSLGFATDVPPSGELRYRFKPRKEVPDERLFGGVAAEVHAEGTDRNGQKVQAVTSVTVTR